MARQKRFHVFWIDYYVFITQFNLFIQRPFFPVQYPKQLGKFQVKNVRDLTVGFDSAQPDCKPV